MKTWRMAWMTAFFPVTLGASALSVTCNDDVDTDPWYPNYTDSGYGGAKAKAGAGGAAVAGASGGGGLSSAGSSGTTTGSGGLGDSGEGGGS